jgi:hypothetical protein
MAGLTFEEGAKTSLDIIFNKGPDDVNGKMSKIFVDGWETTGKVKGFNVYDGANALWYGESGYVGGWLVL